MKKFTKVTIDEWTRVIDVWMLAHPPIRLREEVKTGAEAWAIASRCGVTRDAYTDLSVTDGHIQTALEKIFPNAVFLDSKVY